jgi:hypothetical protein
MFRLLIAVLFGCSGAHTIVPVPAVNVSSGDIRSTWNEVTTSDGCYVGLFIQKAISSSGKPPFQLIQQIGRERNENLEAFFQLDICRAQPRNFCIFPQVYALDQITAAYPDAYYLLTRRRNSMHQAEAMHTGGNERVHEVHRDKLSLYQHYGYLSRFAGQSPQKSLVENGALMVEGMHNITRSYFLKRPKLKFLELETTEFRAALTKLHQFLGVQL